MNSLDNIMSNLTTDISMRFSYFGLLYQHFSRWPIQRTMHTKSGWQDVLN